MNSGEINILIKLKDEASEALKGLSGSLKNMEPMFKGMATAGAVGFAAVSALAIKSIGDFADAEKSAAMLEHAVIGVTHATQAQFKATSDLADQLEKKGVLDGDNIKQGLAQLSTFGLSNDAVQKLGGSLADLAVNQFGVKASGEQLSDSANMIAKALNGQFGVLEKSGIRFSDAQKSAIQFGTEMEKVKAINEGFAQNLKYTNEVALTTTEGKMAAAAVQAGNLSESIGGALKPAVDGLVATLKPMLEKMTAWASEHPKLVAGIVIAVGAISGLLLVVGTLGLVIPSIIAGFTAIGTVMALVTWPITLIALAIAAVIAIGVLLYKHWDEVKAFAIAIWTAIKDFFITTFDSIKAGVTAVFQGIADFLTGIWETIKAIFTFALLLIVAGVLAAFSAMGIDLVAVFQSIGLFFTTAWEGLKNIISLALSFITTAWNTAWQAIKDFIIPIWEGITGAVSAGWTAIKAIFTAFTDPITKAWKGIWDGLGGVVSDVWKGITDSITGSINWIIGKINSFIDSVNSVTTKAAGVVHLSAPQIGKIPMLAKGGIVNKPTLAMIGEAGPEAVVPLSGRNGFGGGVTVNIYGGNFLSEDVATDIGDLIFKKLKLSNQL